MAAPTPPAPGPAGAQAAGQPSALAASSPARQPLSAKLEILIAAALTAAAITLHLRFFLSAGPLWRDEAATLAVATSATLHDLWTRLPFDSFPLGWELIVRAWARLDPISSDRGLRLLGLAVGLGIVAALWRSARLLGARSPVASLALLQFTGITVFYGDSLRGYGPGMLAGLVSFGLLWCYVRQPTARRAVLALAASLLSVHVLFYNCVWLLAASCGGLAVCALHRRWRAAAAVVGMGIVCCISMLVYLPMMRGRAAFAPVLLHTTTLTTVYDQLCQALQGTPVAATIPLQQFIWSVGVGAAIFAALVGCVMLILRPTPRPADAPPTTDALVYCAVTLAVGVAAYAGFLIALQNYMQVWYFLAGMAMVAACADGLLAAIALPAWRLLISAAAAVTAVMCFVPAWRSASVDMSNVDQAAAVVRNLGQSGDVVVLTPWWLDQSFVRCDCGAAQVCTLPPVADLRYARYDLVVAAMQHSATAADPVLQRCAAALQAGGRVWVVNVPSFPLFFTDAARLHQPKSTWHDGEYFLIWNAKLAALLQRHAAVVRMVPLEAHAPVHRMENVQLFEAHGWHQ